MKGTNSLKVQMTKAHQKDTDNLNSPLFTKEIGFIDETYPQKTPSSDGFTGDSIKHLEEIILILYKLLQKIEEKGILSHLTFWSSNTTTRQI